LCGVDLRLSPLGLGSPELRDFLRSTSARGGVGARDADIAPRAENPGLPGADMRLPRPGLRDEKRTLQFGGVRRL
jgi:hypothetical protein